MHLFGLDNAELSVLFVNDRRMRMLNRNYRGVDRITDVLSFPQLEASKLILYKKGSRIKLSTFNNQTSLILGDIVINLHQTQRQAKEHSLTFNEELKRLLVHGFLHLIGYDHERGAYDKKRMKRREKGIYSPKFFNNFQAQTK